MKKLKSAIAIIVCLAIVSTSCKTPDVFTISSEPDFELEVVKTISYEVETVTTRITEDGNESEISQIRAMPIIDRSAVRYGIDKYGATELFIDMLEPDQKLPADDIPPNDFVEAKYIHIVNGTGSFYDANRTLLYTQPMEDTNVAQVEEFAASQEDMDDMLKTAQANGAIINDLGNGFTSVRMSNEQFSNASQTNGTYTVTIFNTVNNTPIGSVVYDITDRMLFRMYAQAETNASGKLVLKATQQEVFDKNTITNLTTVIKTNSVYSNMLIENQQ